MVPTKLNMIQAMPISMINILSVMMTNIPQMPTTRMPKMSMPTILSAIDGPLTILYKQKKQRAV